MESNFSKESFFKFLDYLADKDLVKHKTVSGWRSAASKLMVDLSDSADVRSINLDIAAHKAANRDSNSLSPESLRTYKQRTAIAIEEFRKWCDDPANYKPRGLNGQARAKKSPTRSATQNGHQIEDKNELGSDTHPREVAAVPSGLTLSYPLRNDFLAQVVIPSDLKVLEAKRLGAFLLTIASDYQPE